MIYGELFWAFLKIGLFGFGGGLAIISLIYDNIQAFVSMSPSQFADIVAIAQATPGPVAVNAATYVGYESAGYLGAFAATFAVVLPAFVIIALVVKMVDKYKESLVVSGGLEGVRPATTAMIATALITIGVPTFLTDKTLGANIATLSAVLPHGVDIISILMCIAAVVAIGKYKVNAFKVLIVLGCIGALLGV